MSEEKKLSGPAFTPAQHIEAFYYVPDLIKRELPPEAVFSLQRVKLYILLIYTRYIAQPNPSSCALSECLLKKVSMKMPSFPILSWSASSKSSLATKSSSWTERGETEKVNTAAACRHWCAFPFALKSCARMRRTTTLPATSGTVASSLLLSASS